MNKSTNLTRSFGAFALRSALAAAALALLAATTPAQAAGRNPNPGVLPVGSKPYGKTYGDWGAEWWKWAYSFPVAQNPIQDPTGEFAVLNQSGPVWFLAGTFGGTAERTVTIPAGKAIFFALFNIFNDYPCPDPNFQPAPGQTLEEFLAEGAAAFIDPATHLAADVVEHQYRTSSTTGLDQVWSRSRPIPVGSPLTLVSLVGRSRGCRTATGSCWHHYGPANTPFTLLQKRCLGTLSSASTLRSTSRWSSAL